MSAVSLMYQLSAPRLNKEGSFSMFRPSLDELIQGGFGGIVQIKKKAENEDLFLNTISKQLSRCRDEWPSVLFDLSLFYTNTITD